MRLISSANHTPHRVGNDECYIIAHCRTVDKKYSYGSNWFLPVVNRNIGHVTVTVGAILYGVAKAAEKMVLYLGEQVDEGYDELEYNMT